MFLFFSKIFNMPQIVIITEINFTSYKILLISMKLRHTESFYEGSGALDFHNDNSIPVDGISVSLTGGFPVIDPDEKPTAAEGTSIWPFTQIPGIDQPPIDCCSSEPTKSETMTDNSILISLFSTVGLIIIASLVGFSFTKRPCLHENIISATTGTSANLVTQSSTTVCNTTASVELTNINFTVEG